jgi:hypothetical protein
MATTSTTRPLGSASDATLAGGTRPSSSEAPRTTLSPPDPVHYDAYLSDTTTRPASPAPDEKKDVETAGSVKEEASGPEDGEYPTGWAFTFIVVALVLSIFLVSLDMVRGLSRGFCRVNP